MKQGLTMKNGFTLLEMIISISVIALLSVLFITNYHSANKRTDLILAAQNLVADLHAAQNNALGLAEYNGAVPAGGWGISLATSSRSYVLFADLEAPGVSGNLSYDPAAEGNVNYGARVTTLPANISISNLATAAVSSTPAVNATFLPPDPQTNIYNVTSGATSTSLEVTLKESLNNTVKTVRVNWLGLIEVID
jgi:prepilin-type N-terminal cleavage/methylation domain-containing protein